MHHQPGSLVRVRHRDWVVMPSNDPNLLLLKPLGGSDEEMAGIYLPLRLPDDRIESAEFSPPSREDLGNLESAQLLYDAARLSFRNAAGPFRCLGKLSFRPRSYQMIPLIMALRQEPVRLLIADDVGVGKTIEALLIARELLERRIVQRFAVVCLPHLCDQWQAELHDKFGIEAVIIRSNTQARLDREIHGDIGVYQYYPYQVISIDFIKSQERRQVFIQDCPELLVVDEAHTCARPAGASITQQQRYNLIHDLARKQGQHLILLTATPHSGKPEEFQSLLGLLKPEFEMLDISKASQTERRQLARHFVQRRRADVEKWLGENTPFPKRDAGEFPYNLTPAYHRVFEKVQRFAKNLTRRGDAPAGRRRVHYWTALALMRGVMSSPAAAIEMLRNRMQRLEDENPQIEEKSANPVLDEDYGYEGDYTPSHLFSQPEWSQSESRQLAQLCTELESLQNLKSDHKATWAAEIIKDWLSEGYNPVVFCRYIATAKYLGTLLIPELEGVNVQVVTSEDPDEVRKERIDAMAGSTKRVLIATDCLSEGINLQELFTAVLHYDLPWNPNKLEQREGRVDRYGQSAPVVKTYLLFAKDNPIDGIVLKVILRKVREIRRAIGISIPFPEDSKSIIDTVLQTVLLEPERMQQTLQMQLEFAEGDRIREQELRATKAYEEAAEREKLSRSIFAQHTIRAEEIEADLQQIDQAIGNPEAVERFVVTALKNLLGVQISRTKNGYALYTTNLPESLKHTLPDDNPISVSFFSPTPEKHLYLGRNHLFVEQLCHFLLANALDHNLRYGPARAAVIKCREVEIKTTILLLRVRNVIEDSQRKNQLVAEEMLLWGFQVRATLEALDHDTCEALLARARPSTNLSRQAQADFLETELQKLPALQQQLNRVAYARAQNLVEAHERFRKAVGGAQHKVVEPVLPMDVMGIYILLPDRS